MSETGRPPESATFDVSRVGSGRGRPPILLVGFVALIAGVVAFGVSGREQAPSPVALATSAPSAQSAPSAPAAVVVPAQRGPQVVPSIRPANFHVDPVRLLFPRRDNELVLSPTIPVVGSLSFRAGTIRIELRTEGRDLLDAQVLDTGDGDGIRPDYLPTFDVDLRVPSRTATGRLWIVITAYDRAGAKLESFSRTVRFGVA